MQAYLLLGSWCVENFVSSSFVVRLIRVMCWLKSVTISRGKKRHPQTVHWLASLHLGSRAAQLLLKIYTLSWYIIVTQYTENDNFYEIYWTPNNSKFWKGKFKKKCYCWFREWGWRLSSNLLGVGFMIASTRASFQTVLYRVTDTLLWAEPHWLYTFKKSGDFRQVLRLSAGYVTHIPQLRGTSERWICTA